VAADRGDVRDVRDAVARAGAVDIDPILDSAPCGFVSFSDDGTIDVANSTLATMLGYQRAELRGRHIESLLSIGSRIFYQTHLFPLVSLHGHAEEIFVLLRPKAGADVPAMLNAVRHERDGRFVNDCVLVEVRERHKFEAALLRAKKEAEQAQLELREANERLEAQAVELEMQQQLLQDQAVERHAQQVELERANDALRRRGEELETLRAVADDANRAKSAFLAVMSHELRTPLNAIAGYAQLIELGIHGPVTDAQREALERIVRSQRHLLRLINDVLNLSRIEAGRVEYEIEAVVLADVVAAVLPMIEPQLGAKGLACDVSIPPTLRARADREKLQQIVLNLLTNATKFTLAGGRITVRGRPDPDVAERVRLEFQDTGIGIAPEMQKKLFQPFVQVDISHIREAEGSGLGLAISRDLARGMGGDLTVTSALGQGSTFTVALPAA
jgi:PAS domain S-box-containing protein